MTRQLGYHLLPDSHEEPTGWVPCLLMQGGECKHEYCRMMYRDPTEKIIIREAADLREVKASLRYLENKITELRSEKARRLQQVGRPDYK